ncbi:MAG: peptidylprolyl isomerase [Planctomycetaceae bacterium]
MRRTLVVLFVGIVGLSARWAASGADEAAPPLKKKSARKGEVAADPADWKSLISRRDELRKESQRLQQELADADANRRQQIVLRQQQMEAEYYGELQPKFYKLAPQIYEMDPTDPEAAEVMAGRAYAEHKFADALRILQKSLDADHKSLPLYAMKATVQFATNRFDAALDTLRAAQQVNPKQFDLELSPLLESITEYAKFWQEEQAIRAKEAKADNLPRVLFKTSRGEILLELFENEAPNTVANFISLVEGKAYDGTTFHRVEPLFVAQGGDPNTLDADPSNDGYGGPGYCIACECYAENARKHFQGSISMAHAGKDTGGSQFFLTHQPTAHLNYFEGKPEANHTVFGRIIKGLDVALALKKGDKLEQATVVRKRKHDYVPEKMADRRGGGKKPARKPSIEIE